MLEQIRQMYKDAKQVHNILYEDLQAVEKQFTPLSTAEKADVCYGLRKTSELLDDIRKQVDKLRKKLEIFTCLEMQSFDVDHIKTTHCTSKIKAQQFVKFPAKRRNDPDKFDAMMKFFNVPEELIGSEAVRFNWEGFSHLFTQRQAQGLPLPDGVSPDDVYTEYELATRKIKDVDED